MDSNHWSDSQGLNFFLENVCFESACCFTHFLKKSREVMVDKRSGTMFGQDEMPPSQWGEQTCHEKSKSHIGVIPYIIYPYISRF